MKFYHWMLAIVLALGASSAAFGEGNPIHENPQDGSRFLEELNERDWEALHEFINTKRTIDVKEKASNLTISGDVRFEWRHMDERINHKKLRGRGCTTLGKRGARPDTFADFVEEEVQDRELIQEFGEPLPISKNDFDIECNLWFDYVAGRAWAVAQLQFDNSAGVDDEDDPCDVDPQGWHGSGRCNDLCLKRAYFGYNLYTCNASRLDIEVGRRKLYNIFDSKVQFLSRFDGILLKYSNKWEMVADWYWQFGGFVVDEKVDQFAWATEIGFLNIMDSGFDFKYSLIDWQKHGRNRCLARGLDCLSCFERNPKGFNFIVSQFLVYYHLNPEVFCVPAYLYGAFLMNHAQHRHHNHHHHSNHHSSHHHHHKNHHSHKDDNLGWYVGFTVGEVVREGDWAIDIEYQVVQAFAVPDQDVAGISRGNVLDNSITGPYRRGNTNFEGWKLEGLYAITDDLSLDTIIEWSKEYDKSIGGRHRYSKFELEAIYAF